MKTFISIVLCFLPFWITAQTDMPSPEEIEKDKEYQELKKNLEAGQKEIDALMAEYNNLSAAQRNDDTYKQSFQKRYDEILVKQNTILGVFISEHPDSFVSLIALAQADFDSKKTADLYNGLSERIKGTKFGQSFGKKIRTILNTSIGSKAPDFAQNNVSGESVNLSDFKGKYVLIDFWASWCGPCRKENPHVVKTYDTYKDKNFTILGVSLDKNKAAWQNAIQKDGLAWTQVSDLKGWENEAASLFGVQSIPQNFLLDPNGIIIEKNLLGENLQRALEKILK